MINVPLTSQVRTVASFPEKAPVARAAVWAAQQTEAALLRSGTANPHGNSPLPQPLCEPVFPQQIRVIERERAVHSFGKYCLGVSAGSPGKQVHSSSKVEILFLSPRVKTRGFLVLLFLNGSRISVCCAELNVTFS